MTTRITLSLDDNAHTAVTVHNIKALGEKGRKVFMDKLLAGDVVAHDLHDQSQLLLQPERANVPAKVLCRVVAIGSNAKCVLVKPSVYADRFSLGDNDTGEIDLRDYGAVIVKEVK